MGISAYDLGTWLKSRRRELNLTQEELAQRVGVARQWVVRLERGNARAELGPLLRTFTELSLELRLEPQQIRNGLDLNDYVQSFTGEPTW
ncbi:helix-turn-helix domain-containing protein [Leifsonia sp. McL0607]|uniref:helix-turn-helix domain-containing protein n=1 Tax=Leifsonia sp. McL0607 TaxID=3415672 RepID=UPI003CF4AA5E